MGRGLRVLSGFGGVATNTVITAAGDSRRLFLSAGFGQPKSLTPWKGKMVLARAVESYSLDLNRTAIAVNADEDAEWAVGSKLARAYPEASVVKVPTGTKGALATALVALVDIGDAPLVVAAGDSEINGGISDYILEFQERNLDSATIAFKSEESRWSYLSVNGKRAVQQVAEKDVIGPYATTGVFYFRSARIFLEAATWCLVNNARHNGSFYVSSTLNYMVSTGQSVGYSVIERDNYRSWSLPIDFTTGGDSEDGRGQAK